MSVMLSPCFTFCQVDLIVSAARRRTHLGCRLGILRIEGVEIRVDCRNRRFTFVDVESVHRNVVLVKQFLERIDSNCLNRTPFNNLRARLRAVGSIYNLVGRHCRIVDCKSQHHITTVLALSVGLCHSGRGNSHLARHRRRQRDVAASDSCPSHLPFSYMSSPCTPFRNQPTYR